MAWPLRRWFRLCWWVLSTLTLLALPLVIWDFVRKDYSIKYQAWTIGGIFVILSIPISVYEVAMHTEYYTRPRLQRHVIRILWMVPIYAVDAWFALRFAEAREYLDPVRECYEAYVIWNFFAYLMAYLEEELGDVEGYLSRKPPMRHIIPFRWIFRPWVMGRDFLLQTKKGVMNYVILRPVVTAIALLTDFHGKYGRGHIDLKKSYVYLAVVTSFSQMWALYCLAQFYYACHRELAPIRPLSKFVSIKAVVFLTFWQGVVLAVLVSFGVIADDSWTAYEQRNAAAGIQDFLVCIEMFVAALAHAYAFPPKDYMTISQLAQPNRGFWYNVRHMFDLRDVVHDVGEVMESHVDTAADAVSQTTHAVLYVPKKAVKGLKAAAHAPQSLLSNFLNTGGDGKSSKAGSGRKGRSKRKSGRLLSSDGDAGDEEQHSEDGGSNRSSSSNNSDEDDDDSNERKALIGRRGNGASHEPAGLDREVVDLERGHGNGLNGSAAAYGGSGGGGSSMGVGGVGGGSTLGSAGSFDTFSVNGSAMHRRQVSGGKASNGLGAVFGIPPAGPGMRSIHKPLLGSHGGADPHSSAPNTPPHHTNSAGHAFSHTRHASGTDYSHHALQHHHSHLSHLSQQFSIDHPYVPSGARSAQDLEALGHHGSGTAAAATVAGLRAHSTDAAVWASASPPHGDNNLVQVPRSRSRSGHQQQQQQRAQGTYSDQHVPLLGSPDSVGPLGRSPGR